MRSFPCLLPSTLLCYLGMESSTVSCEGSDVAARALPPGVDGLSVDKSLDLVVWRKQSSLAPTGPVTYRLPLMRCRLGTTELSLTEADPTFTQRLLQSVPYYALEQ